MSGTTARSAARATDSGGKIRDLTLDSENRVEVRAALRLLAQLPFVESIVALPDLHQKAYMEVPSSIAITTREVIVPEFTSVAVNDGMGVVTTTLREGDLTPDRLTAFFRSVNAHSARNFFDPTRYSLNRAELSEAILLGARGVIDKYGFSPSVLGRMEFDGCVSETEPSARPSLDVVPLQLLHSRFSRCEMGLNFGGNHFLEIQAVDAVLDDTVAREWGLERGQVVVMYHLGPGPFSGTLLHHLSRRSKLRSSRVPLFFLSKLLYHYGQRLGQGRVSRVWDAHFRRNGWTRLPESSGEGILFRRALALAMNFGFAYRLATVRAILDGVHEAISEGAGAALLCDVSHNGIFAEHVEGRRAWVARHNACRLEPGKPTIVAGSHDVPSYLGFGLDGSDGTIHSYDHGAGNLIEEYRESGRLPVAFGTVHRHVMTRGRDGRITALEELPMRSSEPIDRLMSCFLKARVMRPVVRLRPLGNLKN